MRKMHQSGSRNSNMKIPESSINPIGSAAFKFNPWGLRLFKAWIIFFHCQRCIANFWNHSVQCSQRPCFLIICNPRLREYSSLKRNSMSRKGTNWWVSSIVRLSTLTLRPCWWIESLTYASTQQIWNCLFAPLRKPCPSSIFNTSVNFFSHLVHIKDSCITISKLYTQTATCSNAFFFHNKNFPAVIYHARLIFPTTGHA